MLVKQGRPCLAIFSWCIVSSALYDFVWVFERDAVNNICGQLVNMRNVVREPVFIFPPHFFIKAVKVFLVCFNES
jgi:hypothetical protein